jgi:hypothetical protein
MSVMEISDVTQLPVLECIPAKPPSTRPEINLQVRLAVVGDKKEVGAASKSRFYLLHPEYDPEERRRQGERRYRDRDGNNYQPRRSGRRRDDDEAEAFDASLYDDDEATLAERSARQRRQRRQSRSEDEDTDYARHNQSKELFPGRRSEKRGVGSARGRSASPSRDLDDDERMGEPTRTASSYQNRNSALSVKDRLRDGIANSTKELFPGKTPGKAHMDDVAEQAATLLDRSLGFPLEKGDEYTVSADASRVTADDGVGSFSIRGLAKQREPDKGFSIKGAAGANARELFPDKFGTNAGRELFAERPDGRGRRRQRAEDLFH